MTKKSASATAFQVSVATFCVGRLAAWGDSLLPGGSHIKRSPYRGVDAALGSGNANVAAGEAEGEAEGLAEDVDVGVPGEGVGEGVGVGVGGGGMMFSQ